MCDLSQYENELFFYRLLLYGLCGIAIMLIVVIIGTYFTLRSRLNKIKNLYMNEKHVDKPPIGAETKEKIVHDIKLHLDDYITNLHAPEVTDKEQELSLTKSIHEI